ncbi:hypothetical protein [Candidatus Parabeggiatoa sp. HSG14]|uniref:hypothetical protein n=1 Tax=Candidatus Parabeggiatoa sp. HSG14 TaxID=3055593 RepID=UPI0025A6C8D8|nr:hypothetical protein [Thiotrichales bacterium HSG14]
MSKKFTLALILLVSTLAVPITSVAASDNKTAIDVHRQAIEELRQEQEELEAVSEATIKKVAEIDIDALVAKYESALAKTTQQIRSQYETKIQQIQWDHAKREKAYENKLRQATELADRALRKAQRQERQVEKLLTKLGAYGGEVKKLTDAVSVSEDGKLGICTTIIPIEPLYVNERTLLEVFKKQQQQIEKLNEKLGIPGAKLYIDGNMNISEIFEKQHQQIEKLNEKLGIPGTMLDIMGMTLPEVLEKRHQQIEMLKCMVKP